MKTKQDLKRARRPRRRNEWLRVVESLDELMEARAFSEKPRTPKTLLDKDTVEALNTAYSATLRYYTALLEKGNHEKRAERMLSKLWQKAGARMRRYEPALASRLKASNRFWSSAVTWERDTIQQAWAHLNSIRTNTNILAEQANAFRRARGFSLS